jgi:hypothetical protein
LISNQVDMQVFEYLKGNIDARKRPEDVQPITDSLKDFIKKRVCFSTLSGLISLYPDAWDISEIIAEELQEFQDEVVNSFNKFLNSEIDITLENKQLIIESILSGPYGESLSPLVNLKFDFLQKKKNLLDMLNNDNSCEF